MKLECRPANHWMVVLAVLGLIVYLPRGAVAEDAERAPPPGAGIEEAEEIVQEEPIEDVTEVVAEEVDEAVTEVDAEPEDTDKPEKPSDDKPWGVSVNAGTSSSMAMFHPTEYVRSYNRSHSLSLGARATYRINGAISARLGAGGAYHLVNPKDLSGRRFFLSDPSLGISHGNIFRDEEYTGIGLSGGLGAGFGLSPASRYWNRYGSLSANLSANRPFLDRKITASWSFSAGVSFTRYTSPTVSKVSDDGLDMALARADGSELLAGDFNLVAGNAQLGSLGNTFSLSFRPMSDLTANISFGVSHSYSYCPPIDHLTSEAEDHRGDRIVRQGDVCRSDGMTGSFGASYNLGDGYSLSGSFNSAQPFFAYRGTELTEESRTLRFPWWDPDLHMTSFQLRASKSF